MAKAKELPLLYMPIDPRLPDSITATTFKIQAGIPNDPNGHVFIINVLLWAANNAPNGFLGLMTPPVLAAICRWPHDPMLLLDALCAANVLARSPDGSLMIFNWEETGGRSIKKREQWREAQSRFRRKGTPTPMGRWVKPRRHQSRTGRHKGGESPPWYPDSE